MVASKTLTFCSRIKITSKDLIHSTQMLLCSSAYNRCFKDKADFVIIELDILQRLEMNECLHNILGNGKVVAHSLIIMMQQSYP